MGAKNVIVTGIVSGNLVRDYIFGESEFSVQYKKNPTENHGGGCTFSSALAGYMAAGNSLIVPAGSNMPPVVDATTGSTMMGHLTSLRRFVLFYCTIVCLVYWNCTKCNWRLS